MTMIVMDASRPYSEVRGERMQDDPLYGVCFRQDGLPFDAQGNLVPDDGAKDVRLGEVDGQKVKYFPLYTDEMRARVDRKKEILERGNAKMAALEEEQEKASPEQREAANEINLAAWLRGVAKYEPHEVFAAVKNRYGVNARKKVDVLDALLALKPPLVNPEEWAEEHKRVLDLKTKAA